MGFIKPTFTNTISNTNAKLDWFVKSYYNGDLKSLITNTHRPMGTVVMPTGYGKSGQMYADALYHIKETDGKVIIIFAGPVLRLVAQIVNDFISPISTICSNLCDNNSIKFFINSSANGDDYDYRKINADPHNVSEINKVFFNDENAKVALIASCYDSLEKIAKNITKWGDKAVICTYLDEAHLIINNTTEDVNDEEDVNVDEKKLSNTINKLCGSNFIYAVTATPNKMVVTEINKCAYEKYKDEFYCENDYCNRIIDILPKQAISENIITPFNMDLIAIDENSEWKISPQMCVDYLKMVHKNDENKVPHKILVNCINTEHLIKLRDELKNMGYSVYSTCSKDGAMVSTKDELKDVDPKDFIQRVDDEKNDCFVLHIKQLTNGIDIKTLTDTIIYNGRVVQDEVEAKIIQTIGRCLRTLGNERGKGMGERTKKYGNVLFVLPNGDTFAHIASQIEARLIKYYGLDGIKNLSRGIEGGGSSKGTHKEFNTTDYSDPQSLIDAIIEDWRVSLDDYIQNTLKQKFDLAVAIGVKKPIEAMLKEINDKFYGMNGEFEMSELVTQEEYLDYILDKFKANGIRI